MCNIPFDENEGFLGDNKECKILFIMREPNSNGEEATTFWFKQVVDKTLDTNAKGDSTSKRQGTRFFNVFKRLAAKILDKDYIGDDEKVRELFKKCCYINMLSAGEKTISKDYKDLMREMKKENSEDERLNNRKEVINELIGMGCKRIITIPEIFEWLCGNNQPEVWLRYDENKTFRKSNYGDATVYEFFHPSYPGIGYDKIK